MDGGSRERKKMMNFAVVGTERGNKYAERFAETETLQEALDYLASEESDIGYAEVLALDTYAIVHTHGNK